ncbi:MAG: CvpA family protein [Bauldia sp.]|nr:CvpA family protein [Bauldia sp.]
MNFTLFDAIVLAVVLISALLAMVRGFVREVLSVASWVLAALAAFYFYESLLGVIYPNLIASETIATIVAVAVIFFVALIIATWITIRIADFVIDSRVGAVDRLLGFVFGAARGVLLLVIAFFFFSWLVPLDEQPDWIANAETRPMLDNLGEQLVSVLPEDVEAMLLDRFRGEEDDGGDVEEGAEPAAGAANDPGAGALSEGQEAPIYDDDSLDRLFEGIGEGQ